MLLELLLNLQINIEKNIWKNKYFMPGDPRAGSISKRGPNGPAYCWTPYDGGFIPPASVALYHTQQLIIRKWLTWLMEVGLFLPIPLANGIAG